MCLACELLDRVVIYITGRVALSAFLYSRLCSKRVGVRGTRDVNCPGCYESYGVTGSVCAL